jgi:hypothetical protein
MRRFVGPIVAVMAALLVSAETCGPAPQAVSFAPAAYGEQVLLPAGQYTTAAGQQVALAVQQNSWVCYAVDSLSEVIALTAAGLCPHPGGPVVAMLMNNIAQGVLWHQRYYRYYDDSSYYNHYVQASSRTIYVQHIHTFEATNATEIKQQAKSPDAKWKGSDGKVQTGAAVSQYVATGKGSFGSGNVRSAPLAQDGPGAALKQGSSAAAQPSKKVDSGGSRTGGFSGGSRSTTSTTTTKTR